MKRGNYEFRRLEKRDAEIVRWITDDTEKPYCYSILFWNKEKEGFEVGFVGDRPIREDLNEFWPLLVYGQKVLDAEFKLMQD
jgi:hypothetical protein